MTSEEGQPAAAGTDAIKPFIIKEVTCPVCQQKSPQRKVKSHLFVEKNRDLDMRPLGFQRSKPGLENIHPLVYYLWHCPHCRYTAWPVAFEDPVKSLPLALTKFRQALLEPQDPLKAAGRLVARLTQGLDDPLWNFPAGVRLHILAIFQLLLVAGLTGARDSLNLGRYYLRLSWLYRELEEDPSLAEQAAWVKQLLEALRADWPKAPLDAEAAALQAALEYEAAVSNSTAMEGINEVCNLILLITRIYIRLGRSQPARAMWSRAHELTRQVDKSKRALEDEYSRLHDQTRSATKLVAEAAKAGLPEISNKIVETDALGRGMRNKVQEVRNLIHDLDDDLGEAQVQANTSPDKAKPKKKRFGIF